MRTPREMRSWILESRLRERDGWFENCTSSNTPLKLKPLSPLRAFSASRRSKYWTNFSASLFLLGVTFLTAPKAVKSSRYCSTELMSMKLRSAVAGRTNNVPWFSSRPPSGLPEENCASIDLPPNSFAFRPLRASSAARRSKYSMKAMPLVEMLMKFLMSPHSSAAFLISSSLTSLGILLRHTTRVTNASILGSSQVSGCDGAAESVVPPAAASAGRSYGPVR
mmetsp:Transcript_1448/g.3146  ORF Transcript_1448/g.3146 Transcript_1448/m.3146 type:complete len:223 (+) Transcript_1448:251-919(+)